MAENQVVLTRVRSYPSGTPGRVLCRARRHHFVVDEPSAFGGPGEALAAGEIFLAGVSACATGLLQDLAREAELPLTWVDVMVEATLDMDAAPVYEHVSVFHSVHLEFQLRGIDDKQAQPLVETFKKR